MTTIDVEATATPAEPETKTMALATVNSGAIGRALTLDELHSRLEFVRNVMRQEMREGQDFGKIPGTGDKPSLLQPGAQKLLMTFNLREQIKKETLREIQHHVSGHREYEFTVVVFPAGMSPDQGWDGVGTCSTFESKYRYRKSERKCPQCGKSTIIKGKEEYGGGWVCFKKKGGCGAKFHENHEAILSQSAEDVENEDPADCWNTVRKMAFKRALVAAAINATNTSELWTQDLEDLVQNRGSGLKGTDSKPENLVKPSQARFSGQGATSTPPATKTPQAQSGAQPVGASQGPRAAKPAVFADQETKKRMIDGLKAKGLEKLATEYFQKLDTPCPLMPNEGLADLPLQFVPVTRRQFDNLLAAITDFGNGAEAKHAFSPNPLPPEKEKPKPAPKPKEEAPPAKSTPPASVQAAKAKDPEYWWDVVCPIPNKGQKRDDYMRSPDTIRSLYHAMKTGDDQAQKRLWGFAKHWNPEPREFNGKIYPVSEADKVFRQALDDFCTWEEKHGKDTKGQPELGAITEREPGAGEPQDGPEPEDDVPF